MIGRNILPRICIKLVQEKQKQNVLSVREQEEPYPEIKQWVKSNFRNCVYMLENRNNVL